MIEFIKICQQCRFRTRPCKGACPCTIDGKDIIEHAETGQCPKNLFVTPIQNQSVPMCGHKNGQTIAETIKAAAVGAMSVAKTSLGIDVATPEEQKRRKDICINCPSNVVVIQNGIPHTCGRLLEISKEQGKKTCGCLLSLKILDNSQHCPNEYW